MASVGFGFDDMMRAAKARIKLQKNNDVIYRRGSDVIYRYKGRVIAVYSLLNKTLKLFSNFIYSDDLKKRLNRLLEPYHAKIQKYNGMWHIVFGDIIKNEKDYIDRLHKDIYPFKDGIEINQSGVIYLYGLPVGIPSIRNLKRLRR